MLVRQFFGPYARPRPDVQERWSTRVPAGNASSNLAERAPMANPNLVVRNNTGRLLLPVRFLRTPPMPADLVRRAGQALTKPGRVGIATALLYAIAASILVAALPGARSVGLMAVGYILAAVAAELAGGASRREQAFQYGVILILFAALSGDGATAPLIA
ncbi:MAG: hypothetical protein ACR2PL_02275, partial [Dehalococcoidia bacterium]